MNRRGSKSLVILVLIFVSPVEAQQKLLPAHQPDAIDHFLKNRKPLAKNQDIFIAKQFFKYLMTLPLEAYSCAQALIRKQTLPQLVANQKDSFELFKILRYRNDDIESNFDFTNSGADFENVCDTKHGVCQGLTNLDRRMNMLAYYDASNKLKAQVPNVDKPKERFRYYENLVKKIMKDEPTIIPGFENLLHFSRDPIGRRVLLEAAAINWAKENATIGVVTQVLQGVHGTIDQGEAITLYKKLEARLSLNYNPILYLAAEPSKEMPREKMNPWIHVMQVMKVSRTNEKAIITMKDPNMPIRAQVWENDKPTHEWKDLQRIGTLEIWNSGKMMYQGMPLAEVDFMPGDDIEISRFLVNTQKFCKKNPVFCVEGAKL